MSSQLSSKQIEALAEGAFFAGIATMNADGDATESELHTVFKVVLGWKSRSQIVNAVTDHIKSEVQKTSGFQYNFNETKRGVAQDAFQSMETSDQYRFLWFVEQMGMNVAAASGGNLTGEPISEVEMQVGAIAMAIISGSDLDVPAYRAFIDSAGA